MIKMMEPEQILQLGPAVDLSTFLADGELAALNVGPDAGLYAVFADNKCGTRPYRVVSVHCGEVTLDMPIAMERFNVRDVQPLPGNELLLVSCRAQRRGPVDFDKNGRVYSYDGELVREFLLGDGIQSVQATSDGLIWTSYFDEGVLGARGWSEPVGSSGLVAWDSRGIKQYQFQAKGGLDPIFDCYALNVESDSDTWFYYHTDFPLVCISDRRVKAHWVMPVRGSGAFAVFSGFALFQGGYECRDQFHLFALGKSGKVELRASFGLVDENGEALIADRVVGRSDALYLWRGGCVYRFDVRTAAQTY